MPKRRPASGASGSEDIFGNSRTMEALAAATAPVTEPVAPLREASPVVAVPSAPEPAPEPATEPEKPSETGKKGWQTRGIAQEGAKARTPAPKVTKAESAAPAAAEEVAPAHEPHVTLKLRVPQSMRSDFKRFTAELGAALGVPVDDSNVGRPLLEQFLNEQCERILEAAGNHGSPLKRPANGDAVGMAEFDETLGRIFQEARKRRRTKMTATD